MGSGVVNAGLHTISRNVSVASEGMRVADAGISEAKVSMDNAKRDYDRYAALLAKGAVTQQQYDNAKTLYDMWAERIYMWDNWCSPDSSW